MIGIVSRDQSTVVRAEAQASVLNVQEAIDIEQSQRQGSEVEVVVVTGNVSYFILHNTSYELAEFFVFLNALLVSMKRRCCVYNQDQTIPTYFHPTSGHRRPRVIITGRLCFHRCLSVNTRGVPQSQVGGGGNTSVKGGVHHSQVGVFQSQMGVPLSWDTPPPSQDRMGTLPRPGLIMLEHVTPRAVRLLRFPVGGLSCFVHLHCTWSRTT